jgi:hypothetical protein
VTAPAGDPQQEGSTPDPKSSQGDSQAEKTFTQAQLNSFLASQKREIESKYDGFDDIKAKATQFEQLTESTKSEVQRANESAAEYKARMESESREKAEVKLENLRYRVSAKKGLDPDLWDRVTGTTEEEITADVEKLVTKFGPPGRQPSGPLRSGASAGAAANPKEAAARALRAMRAHQ